ARNRFERCGAGNGRTGPAPTTTSIRTPTTWTRPPPVKGLKASDICDSTGMLPKFGLLDTESSSGTNRPMPTASVSAPSTLRTTNPMNSFFSGPMYFQQVARNTPYCCSLNRTGSAPSTRKPCRKAAEGRHRAPVLGLEPLHRRLRMARNVRKPFGINPRNPFTQLFEVELAQVVQMREVAAQVTDLENIRAQVFDRAADLGLDRHQLL